MANGGYAAEREEVVLTSLQNSRVKEWTSLLDKKGRDRTGLFLVEGVHLVLEAAAAGRLRTVVRDRERGLPEELMELRAGADATIEWIAASPAVMAKCAGTETPPPVFGVADKLPADRAALWKPGALVVALDGLRDPGNVGTIVRSADAVGADAVVLGRGCVDLYNPKTVRSTMGSLFHLPIIEADLTELLPEARRRGARIAGTSLQAEKSCYACDWTGGVWLLMGNESNGLSPEASAWVDESVIIPMRGRAESLNVAMAATVLLFEAMRQRQDGEG